MTLRTLRGISKGCRTIAVPLVLLAMFLTPIRAEEKTSSGTQEGIRIGRMSAQSEWEFGWRQLFVGGNRDVYRSHITLGEGVRLFGLSFASQYPENTGPLFDALTYAMRSWGGDPYNTAELRVEKRGLYRFDFAYSRIVYFNFLPTFANPLLDRGVRWGQHSRDTSRRRSEFQLTLFPDRDVRIHLGYVRDAHFGRAFTTLPLGLDEFVLLNPPRTTTDEYRIGADFRVGRLRVDVEQGFRAFKNDIHTTQPEGSVNLGNSLMPANPTSMNPQQILLTDFAHASGLRGFVPTTRLGLQGTIRPTLSLTGRFAYSDVTLDVARAERAAGTLFDLASLRYVSHQTSTSAGRASRPAVVADLAVTYRPRRRLTFTNAAQFHRLTIAGGVSTRTEQQLGSDLRGAPPPPSQQQRTSVELSETHLHLDAFSNTVEGSWELTPHLLVRAGHRLTHRRARLPVVEPDGPERQEVTTQAVMGGVSMRFSSSLRLFAQIERGSSDHVFTRLSPRRLTRFRVRGHYRPTPRLTLSANGLVTDWRNPLASVDATHRARILTLTTSWTPGERLTFALTCTRSDIRSTILVLHPRLRTTEISPYRADDTIAEGDLMFTPLRNLRLALGYAVVNAHGTFPLNFHQPRGMISYTFPRRVTWSVGWRWYGYNQKGTAVEDYRAHTLTGSLKIAF